MFSFPILLVVLYLLSLLIDQLSLLVPVEKMRMRNICAERGNNAIWQFIESLVYSFITHLQSQLQKIVHYDC